MYYICVDIGGTSIKYGVLSEKGEIFIDGSYRKRKFYTFRCEKACKKYS